MSTRISRRGRGNKVAFVDPERSLTYGELQARSIRFANALRDLGIDHEQRVALLLNDTVDYPVAFWGAIRAGCVAIPLNIYLTLPQYAYILADCRARRWSSMPRSPTRSRRCWTSCRGGQPSSLVPAARQLPRQRMPSKTCIAKADTKPVTADTLSDEVAFWFYTSGSTGDPKGVKHVHSNLMATAKLFGQGILGITENDVVHSASKLFFAYGLGNALTFPLSVGATAVLWPHRPSPEGVFETMRAQPADHFLRRAVALHRAARAQGHRQGRRLRPPAALRLRRRGLARAYRRALARGHRRRRARRPRLDRDAQYVFVEPPGRHSLWLDRQAGARLRGAHRRRARPRRRRRRDRRT